MLFYQLFRYTFQYFAFPVLVCSIFHDWFALLRFYPVTFFDVLCPTMLAILFYSIIYYVLCHAFLCYFLLCYTVQHGLCHSMLCYGLQSRDIQCYADFAFLCYYMLYTLYFAMPLLIILLCCAMLYYSIAYYSFLNCARRPYPEPVLLRHGLLHFRQLAV